MAKNKSEKELGLDLNVDDSDEKVKENKLANILIIFAIIFIWLVIFGILIKMDVGGVGTMIKPALKNVPIISSILPEDEEQIEDIYKYDNFSDAVKKIKELEKELAVYQEQDTQSSKTIEELKSEIARLKMFEENADYYQKLKDEFDEQVVYTENAPELEEYKAWYESIDPENASELYKQVCEELQHKKQIQDWADTYTKMDPKDAAAILGEMTGDTDILVEMLNCMKSNQRAEILAQMDTVFAAKLTKLLYP